MVPRVRKRSGYRTGRRPRFGDLERIPGVAPTRPRVEARVDRPGAPGRQRPHRSIPARALTRTVTKQEVTMIDEIFDRHYQAGRSHLNASITDAISRLGQAIGTAFEVLNRIEYS